MLKAKQNKLKFEDTIKVQMFTCHKILNPNHLSSEFVISPLRVNFLPLNGLLENIMQNFGPPILCNFWGKIF